MPTHRQVFSSEGAGANRSEGLEVPKSRSILRRPALLLLWGACLLSLPIWSHFDPPGWDTKIYYTAMQSLAHGHDPYADATAIQKAAHLQHDASPNPAGPFSYVYSPATLPILRAFLVLPPWLAIVLYGSLYVAGACSVVYFGVFAETAEERHHLAWLTPLAIFFPGFLGSDIVLSGNVAYILYGGILLATILAMRRGRWVGFYLVVLLASCFKAPLLTLLVLALLCGRRQWLPACLAALAGVALFAVQPLLYPQLFPHYLEAVELQFSLNRDFGFSPAGLLSGLLYDLHLPYSPPATVFYLAYAAGVLALLLRLAARFRRGEFSREQWLPVMLAGVLLLNPRLIEYDAAVVALPLALIAWRAIRLRTESARTAGLLLAALFLSLNAFALQQWALWKLTEGPVLVLFFAAGVFTLRRHPGSLAEPRHG